MSSYAFLNEIWTDEKNLKTAPTPCQKGLDNIMDAYMEEPKPVVQEESQFPTKKCWVNEIGGYDGSPLLKNAYEFDSYYKDELENIKSAKQSEIVNTNNVKDVMCEEESTLSREKIYRDLIERYDQSQLETKNNWIDLGIYVFSGIIIIFLMEQVLQVGRSLR